MGIPSNRRSAVEPEKRGRIVYQAAKAGTDHHHSVSPRLSKLIKQAQIRAASAAKPKDDRMIFMLNLQFHDAHLIFPSFGRRYTPAA